MGRKIKKPYMVEEMEIFDILTDGRGIGRNEEQVVFVKGVVPGDVVNAWAYRKEKGSVIAELREIITESEDRTTPKCEHFGECGGCKWQNLLYDKQLAFKHRHVIQTLKRIGKVELGEERQILGMEEPFWYRNKLEFTFSSQRWFTKADVDSGVTFEHAGALGYNAGKVFYKAIHIDNCYLQIPIVNDIRNELDRFAKEEGISYHDMKAHEGYLRNIIFRTTVKGELMIILLVHEDKPELLNKIFSHLESKFPEITSFVSIVNDRMNSSYGGLDHQVWKGTPHITEELGPWKYRVSPTSFFQTNTYQAKVLYDVVREFVGEKTGTIYDLYAGAGSIGIYLSDLADKIVGIEYAEAAVKDAAVNLEINNLDHLEFYAGDMQKLLTDEWVTAHGRPDVIVTDPPRAGMAPKVVAKLLEIECPRIVYVSCKPSTQARDLELLSAKYDVKIVQPVDMFPNTAHVENVVLLELRS